MLKLFGLRARRRLCCTFGLVLALTAGWVAPAAADGIEPISTIEPSSTIEPLATEDVTGSTDDVALLGHWDFEDSSAPGLDSSAAGRHGTLQGNASLVRGRMAGDRGFEQALAFDGASYLTVPNQGADLNGLATVTVAAWLRVPSHRQTNVFRIQQPLALNSDGFSVANYATGGGWQSLVASEAPPVDRWYHLVAVFDHGEMRLYLDGAKVASRSVAFGSLQGTAYDVWSFGARWVEGAADQFLRGTLDDLRIYGRALDSDEIEVLGFRHQEPFQLGAWTFDDETEPGRDVSGAERHALLVGEVDLTRGRIQANGFASGALRLDGAGHLEIPAPGVDLGGLEQFTVEAWVSTAEGPSPNVFRAQTPAALDSQAFDVWSATTGWSAVTASLAPDDDRWHHIAGVFDRGEARFYLNGRLVDVDNLGSPAPGPDAADVWAIGARVGAGVLDQHFAGAIDEVRLWSGALTHLEVAQRASQIILPATEPQAASGGLCSPPPVACGEAEACVAEAVASCERATANHCLPPVSPKCGSCLVKLISGRGFPYIRLAECFTSCGVGPLIEFIDCRGGAMRDLVNEAYGCNCFLCSGEPCPSPYDVRVQAAGLRFDEVATFGVACEGGGSAAPELVRVSGSHPSSAVFCQAEETWQVTQAGVFDANLGTYLRSCSPSTRTGTGSPGTVVDVDFDCHCDDDCDPPGRPLTVEACLPEDFNNSISVATRVTGPAGEDLGIARTTLSRAGTFDLGLTAPVGSTYSDAEIGPSPSGFFCFADQYPGNTVAGGLPDGQPVLVARVVCHPAGGSATDCNGLIDGHRLFGLARPLRGDPAPSPTVQIQVSRPDGTVKTSRGTAFAEGQFSLHVKAPQGSTWQAELVSSDECILNPESGVINQPGSNDLTLLHVACVPTHEKYETVNFVLDPDPLALGYPWGWGGLADCRHVCPLAPTVQPLDCRPIIDPVTGIILGEVCEVTAEHCKIVCTDENLGPAAFFSVAGTRVGNRITADTELQISGRAEDDDGIKGFSFYITRATTPEQIELTAYRPSSGVFSDYALDTSGLTEGDYTLFLVAVDDHPTASTPAIAELPFQVRHDASSPPGPCAVDDTRPSIDLLTPEDGEVIATDDVVLEATADDGPNGTGISQVKFYVNGGRAIHTATSPPYRTTWQATPGVHAIKARAYDECGNIRSETATVIVGEAVCGTSPAPPVVTLVAPEDGSALEPGLTDIQVTASAPAGVERVELFIDRRPIHVLEEAPFDFGFWFSVEGTYRLEARAYDACGQSTLSEPTMVRVTHSAPPCASDSNPPSVEVTAPVDGVPQPHGEVTLVATAEDPELFVAWVIFEIDGVVPDNGVVMAPPYSITWQGEPGEHTVKVWAEDVCGNVAATPPTTFTLFNERPRPLPDQATTRAGSAVVIPVLANDSDPNGDPIQLAINEPFPEQPAHGAVAIQGEDVVYTPHPGFGSSAGEIDTFWYRIVDPHGGFRATKVTVVVLDMP